MPADTATVTIETNDPLLNVDEFRRHVLAAVAIADALEDRAAHASPAE